MPQNGTETTKYTQSKLVKSDSEKRYTLDVVYEPFKKDTDDHWAGPEAIEEACWAFQKNLKLGEMHLNKNFEEIGEVVENYIAPVDMIVGEEIVKKGSWLIGCIWKPEIFEKIKKGEYTGVSLEGVGLTVEREVPNA
jgi:hypothetical protein